MKGEAMEANRRGRKASTARGGRWLVVSAAWVSLVVFGGIPAAAHAQEFPRGTKVNAVAFYDTKGPAERLVTVVLYPAGNGSAPQLQNGSRITRRVLGTGTPDQFGPMVRGMKQKSLAKKGQLLAAVYFVSAVDGDYASIVTYLTGEPQIIVEDPANLKPIEGSGGDGGGGGGDGGGGGH
jgi:hypothetical protein